jgi:16S rRNA processing protein RimM
MTRILLGVITGAHGIRGEVKIKSFTDNPKAIAGYGPLQVADGRVIEIARLKPAKDFLIASLKNVTDRNAAEALRGVELFGSRDNMGGDVLLSDLIGKQVSDGSSVLGRIYGFQNFGAGELMELEGGVLIPVRFVVSSGDDVVVDLPEGFLES